MTKALEALEILETTGDEAAAFAVAQQDEGFNKTATQADFAAWAYRAIVQRNITARAA